MDTNQQKAGQTVDNTVDNTVDTVYIPYRGHLWVGLYTHQVDGGRQNHAPRGAEFSGSEFSTETLKTTKQKHHAEGSPWYLNALPTLDSIVLALRSESSADELSAGVLETLAALASVQVTGGIPASSWRVVVGKPEQTFYRHRKLLLTTGLVDNVGSDKQPRYQVSGLGTTALS